MKTVLPHFREELFVAYRLSAGSVFWQRLLASLTLLSSEQTDEQNTSPVHCEQRANRIELSCEDLEYDECERELAYGSSNIGSLKRSLRRADLYHLSRREND